MAEAMDEAGGALGMLAGATGLGFLGGAGGSDSLSVTAPFETEILLCDEVRIARVAHGPKMDDLMEKMPDDAALDYVREPDNAGDPWAIRVEYHGFKLGYVPADRNEILARLMDGGKVLKGVLLDQGRRGDWWRLTMEVSLVD